MADENILKEFLVSLGFKVDPASENRFKDSVKSATDSMKEFSVAVAAAATETLIGLNRMANNLGALHFQSQRVGASANSIKAFQLAIQQAGGTAEGASSALETLATKFRESPGWEQKLNGMGIATRDATGKARDNAEVLLDLGQKLAKMNNSQAMAEGRALGIDEKTILALRDPATIKAYQDQIDLQKQLGINLDDSSAKATAFSQEMNKLKATFDAFTSSAVGDLSEQLLPALQATNEGLREFADWFHALPPESQQAIKTIAEIGAGLALIVTNLKLIAAAKGVLGALGGKAIPPVPPTAPTVPPAAAAGSSRLLGFLGKLAGGVGLMLHSEDLNQGEDEFVRKRFEERKKKAKPAATPPAVPKSLPSKADAKSMAMAFFQNAGWSKEQSAGLVANLMAESKLNPGAVGDSGKAFGIAQWHPDRQANFAKWSGKDIRQSSLQDQLAFVVYELTKGSEQKAGNMLRMANSAQRAGEVVSRMYERPLMADQEAMKRGTSAVQISQSTQITVNGTETPRETAQAVAGAQNDVNANLVRNSLPVVR